MSDVIFAGSPTRAAAGHARVEIVIDNADGRLSGGGVGTAASAAEFSEIRVARTIHGGGETAYEINGEEVRALDVQELLSDPGLGRELHTIVGQGQLDEILNAKPEERRAWHFTKQKDGSLDMRPAVTLALAKRKGANAVVLAEALLERLATVRGALIPADVAFTVTRN